MKAEMILIFLPSYSPDYNSIKTSFAILKAWLCYHICLAERYIGGFEQFLKNAILQMNEEVFQTVNDQIGNPKNLFKNCQIGV